MVIGAVGTLCGVAAFVMSVAECLVLVAPNQLLDVLAHDHPGVHDEEVFCDEFICSGG